MEAMRSAAHIKSGVLLSGVGNKASSAGWGTIAGGIYNGTLFLHWGFGLCAQFSCFWLSSLCWKLEMRRNRGQKNLWWYLASHPKPGANGSDQSVRGPNACYITKHIQLFLRTL